MSHVSITSYDPSRDEKVYVGFVATEYAIFRIIRRTSQNPFHRIEQGYGIGEDALKTARSLKATRVCIVVVDDDSADDKVRGRTVAEFWSDLDLWFDKGRRADYGHGMQRFLGPDDLPKKMPKLSAR